MNCMQAFWRPRSNSVQIGVFARGSLGSQGACRVSPIVGRKETVSTQVCLPDYLLIWPDKPGSLRTSTVGAAGVFPLP